VKTARDLILFTVAAVIVGALNWQAAREVSLMTFVSTAVIGAWGNVIGRAVKQVRKERRDESG
jgi:hypothetical protein